MTTNQILNNINRNQKLSAWVEPLDGCEHEGLIAVELDRSNGVDSIGFEIERLIGRKTLAEIEFVDGDDASNIAWFKSKES